MNHRKHHPYDQQHLLHCCRVCGAFYEKFYPWGEDGKMASFAICQCCGVEFGNDDETPDDIQRSRKEWLKSGADWLKEKEKPKDWDRKKQLENLMNEHDVQYLLDKFKLS